MTGSSDLGPKAAGPSTPAANALRATVVGGGPAGAGSDGPPPLTVATDATGPTVDGTPTQATLEPLGPAAGGFRRGRLRVGPGGPVHHVLIVEPTGPDAGDRAGVEVREVVVDGWRFEVELEPAARAALRERAGRGREDASSSGPASVRAIIPGVVVSVSVAPGDVVSAGQQLLVVEAMKMQNELRAPRAGTIGQVAAGQGATIDVGDLLVVIE